MANVATIPCPLCGYHAPELACPHCGLAPREPTLRAPSGGVGRELRDGFVAPFHGARVLLTTTRTKRLLVPPVLLTGAVFGAVFAWCTAAFSRFFESVRAESIEGLGLDPGYWRDVVSWLAGLKIVVAIAHAGSLLVLLVALTIAALWTFSVAYEALCGPFLDTIQARIEQRWFGADPRATLERPTGIDPERSARAALLASLAIAAQIAVFWVLESPWAWLLVAGLPIPLLVAARVERGTLSWLGWFLASQGRALWTSLKASALAALILVAFLWLKLVPFLGLPLFAMVAGFATALTLLDIPFSRRNWSLAQRVTCLFQHLPAVLALGIVTGLIFVVPFFGPLVGVPCASIGGQWLLCRIDKDRMRPPGRRIGQDRGRSAAASTA